jgi:glycosyltransferase involved in cell wall biosynthesis
MITIITPTYNRAYIINKAYESLCRQTSNDFEWIIVDDGSADNTEEVVKLWLQTKLPFELKYFKQQNGGKHRAVNTGVQMAQYDYIMILDSDDHLADDAVEKIHKWIKTIENEENFAGVSGLRGWINKPGCIGGAGDVNAEGYVDAKNTERRKYHLQGDKAEIYKTEILKKFPFPEFEGERFLSEHVVWDSIAKAGYKLRWFSEVIYKCEYLEDGLTRSTSSYNLQLNSFEGFTLSTVMRKDMEIFPWNLFSVGVYAHVAKLKGLRTSEIKKRIQVNSFQLLLGRAVFQANELKKKLKKK